MGDDIKPKIYDEESLQNIMNLILFVRQIRAQLISEGVDLKKELEVFNRHLEEAKRTGNWDYFMKYCK